MYEIIFISLFLNINLYNYLINYFYIGLYLLFKYAEIAFHIKYVLSSYFFKILD